MARDVERWPGLKPGQRPFQQAAWFYAEYRYRPGAAFFRLLATHLDWTGSDRILDLGAGPAHVSLRLAPFVGEIVALEPDETMLNEGRRRAEATQARNLSLILGGSDDLEELSPMLGEFTGVVISQAFHWMANQDRVLRDLDKIADRKRGAVALVGYEHEALVYPSIEAAIGVHYSMSNVLDRLGDKRALLRRMYGPRLLTPTLHR